jgi:hypothetical protein
MEEISPVAKAADNLVTTLLKAGLRKGIWGVVAFVGGIYLLRNHPEQLSELQVTIYNYIGLGLITFGSVLFIIAGLKELLSRPESSPIALPHQNAEIISPTNSRPQVEATTQR